MARVAAVANVAWPEVGVRQLWNDAVHAAAAAMHGAMIPARRKDNAEVDRARAWRFVDRRHGPVDDALGGGGPGGGVQTGALTVTAATGSPIADVGIAVPTFSAVQSASVITLSGPGAGNFAAAG